MQTFNHQVVQLATVYPSLINVAYDQEGQPNPILSEKAIKTLLQDLSTNNPKIRSGLKNISYHTLTTEFQSNLRTVEGIIDSLLDDAGAFSTEHGSKSGRWKPIVFFASGHPVVCFLIWDGHSVMAVLSGSLGINVPAHHVDQPITGDKGLARLLPALTEAIPSRCSTRHKIQLKAIYEKLKSSSSPEGKMHLLSFALEEPEKPYGQILMLTTQRQHDNTSCSVFVQQDLLSLLPKGSKGELKGKNIYLEFKEAAPFSSGANVGASKKFDTTYKNMFNLVCYPPEMLLPTQSMTTLRQELDNLESYPKLKEHCHKVTETLKPYLKQFTDKESQQKTVNLYAMAKYAENLLALMDNADDS
ncbi:MAG: hypothetical protein ACR2PX_02615 [Endozoicomonas sp.]|uniref:hypothetical protein n=1 Tax=Endozoicomonas sp. TaxID=1892382 RepID=UPI003D9BB24A